MKNLTKDIIYSQGETINEFCETYNVTNDQFNKYFKRENNNIYIKAGSPCQLILHTNNWPQIKLNDNLILDVAFNNDEIKNYVK